MSKDHSAWNCPKNQKAGTKPPGKPQHKQVHAVQVLPLKGTKKYTEVEVYHEDRVAYHRQCDSPLLVLMI